MPDWGAHAAKIVAGQVQATACAPRIAFSHLPSTIHDSLITIHVSRISLRLIPNGGIAQLVERQLCKLEVRGSNPLASSPESVPGCRAVASAKADFFHLEGSLPRATTRHTRATARVVAESRAVARRSPAAA